jgi:acetyltransferase-like isoleucine patch superfamily enzyme
MFLENIKRCVRSLEFKVKQLKKPNIVLGKSIYLRDDEMEGQNKIGDYSVITNCRIGRGSYIGEMAHFNRAVIGRYCSFGSRIRLITGTHPASLFVSTHPAFFSTAKQAGFTYVQAEKFQESIRALDSPDIAIMIGNDVWIGDDVTLIAGITIGDGVIIGTKSLVTKDVGSYEIVGGVPARRIRFRFSEDEIKFLLEFRWWNRSEEWIAANAEKFSDIRTFMEEFRDR